MKYSALIVFISATLLAACATIESFAALDTDGDGRISRKEATPSEGMTHAFDYSDSNQDGYLTPPEYDTARLVIDATMPSNHGTDVSGGGSSTGGHSGGHQH